MEHLVTAEAFGWIGSLLLLTCSIPQAYMSVKEGHSRGLSPYMLWLWIFGMIFMLCYLVPIQATPAIISNTVNLFVAGTITWYYHFPQPRKILDA
ncbi:MAG: hypothetical protein DDT31_00054 [Syntrophomonadaceae bacterium]|nr:hypothetical protein [Bacillota bacterium]